MTLAVERDVKQQINLNLYGTLCGKYIIPWVQDAHNTDYVTIEICMTFILKNTPDSVGSVGVVFISYRAILNITRTSLFL